MRTWRCYGLLAGISLLLLACPNKKNKDSAQGPRIVEAKSSSLGILRVGIDINVDSAVGVLTIQNIPANADLTCTLNKKPLGGACDNGGQFQLPSADGEHVVTVVARVEDVVKAVGEAHFRTGAASSARRITSTKPSSAGRIYNSDLTLEPDPNHLIDGQPFYDGMAIKRTDDVVIKFYFPTPPLCDPVLRCSTDSTSSKFAPKCDLAMGKSFKARTMAKGLQFLKVEASCGDKVGEPLTMFWYGVPEDYTYMGLDSVYFGNRDRYVFGLMNPSDCPQNLLDYECRYSHNGSFGECRGKLSEKNVIDDPPAGFAIRAVCNGTRYQAYEPDA